jgi:hypothetical protein
MRDVFRVSSDQNQLALRSVSLSRDPLADIWIAIRQLNAGRFALSEKIDAILTSQSQILKIKNDSAIFSFRRNERFQLGNVLLVDPTAYGKDDVPVGRPLNSQHCVSWRVRVQAYCHRNLLKINTLQVTIIAD